MKNVVERNLHANNCSVGIFYYGDHGWNVYFLASASVCVFVIFLVFQRLFPVSFVFLLLFFPLSFDNLLLLYLFF